MQPETTDALVYLIAYLILNPHAIRRFRNALDQRQERPKRRRKHRRKKHT